MKNIFETDTDIEVVEKTTTDINNDNKKAVWLYNDAFNSFEHVIDSLVEVCKMSSSAAEECAVKVHKTGKCVVAQNKSNTELLEIATELKLKHLDARVV